MARVCRTCGTRVPYDPAMRSERYAVVDVETTGFSPLRDRIVEVACALVDADRIVGQWATLVNPQVPIPASATAIHGITDDLVEGAPNAHDALRKLRQHCGDRTIVAHCARFDLSFLGSAFGKEALCTMRLARALFPEAPNHQNQTLRVYLGIDDAVAGALRAHRALDDATVTAHILIACRRHFRDRFAGEPWVRFARTRALVMLASDGWRNDPLRFDHDTRNALGVP